MRCACPSLTTAAAALLLFLAPFYALVAAAKVGAGIDTGTAKAKPDPDPQAVQKLPEIQIRGTTEPEDATRKPKAPLLKMRDHLDAVGKSRAAGVKESRSADGSRSAKISTGTRTYWIDDSHGQIDFSGARQNDIAKNCWGGCN